jgi:hypothetical protein
LAATLVVVGGTLAVTTAAIRPAYAITFGSTKNLTTMMEIQLTHRWICIEAMCILYGKTIRRETLTYSSKQVAMKELRWVVLKPKQQ